MINKESSAMTEKEKDIDIKQLPNIYTNMYITSAYVIPSPTKSILSEKLNPKLSSNIDYPKFSFGFQHFVHAKKEQLDTLSKFDGKKRVYNVINKFNKQIDDYDSDIETTTKKFLDLNTKTNIIDDNFYGMWEIFHMFGLISKNEKLKSFHMMENGSIVQAILLFRNKYFENISKSDSYHIYNKSNDEQHQQTINKEFLNYYNKSTPNKIIAETKLLKKIDLVTLNLGTNWDYRNMKEQDSLLLFLKQLSTAMEVLNSGGNLICDIFENFTLSANKILFALTEIFQKVIITKPLSTNPIIDNKYLICTGYNPKSSKFNEMLSGLIQSLESNPNKFIVDFCPKFELPSEYLSTIRKANTDISNRQLIDLDKIFEFIDNENYYGDVYQQYRNEQIKASNIWIEKFLLNNKNFNEKSKQIQSEINEIIKTNIVRANLANAKLIL